MTVTSHRGFVEQLVRYFDRPHVGVPTAPVRGPAAWVGADLAADPAGWTVELDAGQVAELEEATAVARDSGRPDGELTAADFPLPTLRAEVERWRRELVDGRGFLLVRGLPVARWSAAEVETACWCLGLHLGRPGAQNLEGDLLGHVTDLGEEVDHPASRLYRTAAPIRFHCDAADVVGLLCVRPAPEGGRSRLVSSVTVFDRLLEERPDLVGRLFEPVDLDSRLEAGREPRSTPVQPCAFDGARLRTFMHTEYFSSVARHAGLEPDERTADALATWEAIAERPVLHLEMELRAGDLQLVSNHTVVHARTGYSDDPDPARRRHLLRLWLSL